MKISFSLPSAHKAAFVRTATASDGASPHTAAAAIVPKLSMYSGKPAPPARIEPATFRPDASRTNAARKMNCFAAADFSPITDAPERA